MFGKKCVRCGEKISERYRYCPSCGALLERKDRRHGEGDWGMLGRRDIEDFDSFDQIRFPRGFNMLFNTLIKNMDKQFRELDREMGRSRHEFDDKKPKIRKGGISISISTAPGKEPEVKVRSFGNEPRFKQREKQIRKQLKEIPSKKLPQKRLRIAKLPKQEPPTHIRRLGDKIVYEIEMPGVKSLRDVSIIKLENSIEIKAISKDKAYIKLIPINLPIINYDLKKGKLVLELEAKG